MELKLLIFAAGFLCGAFIVALYGLREIRRITKGYAQLITQYKQLVGRVIDSQKSEDR